MDVFTRFEKLVEGKALKRIGDNAVALYPGSKKFVFGHFTEKGFLPIGVANDYCEILDPDEIFYVVGEVRGWR